MYTEETDIKIKAALGKLISDKIKQKDIRVADLAEQVGVTREHVYVWMRGNRDISFTSFLKLCRALNIKTRDILMLSKIR